MTGTKFCFIHTYTYIHFFKPIILTQEPQKRRDSSKTLIRKFSPLQSFLFEKAKNKFLTVVGTLKTLFDTAVDIILPVIRSAAP